MLLRLNLKYKFSAFAAKHSKKAQRKSAIALLLMFSAIVVLFSAGHAIAQASFGLEVPAATGLGSPDLKLLIVRIVRIILGFLGIIAVIINMYAGFLWITSKGEEEQISRAKRILLNGVIGLLIIASSYLIASYVINRLTEATIGGIEQAGRNDGYSVNGFALGAGILNNVYPEPGSSGLPRNTLIMAAFKEILDVSTIISPANLDVCRNLPDGFCGYLREFSVSGETRPSVRIINRSDNNGVLAADNVVVYTNDGKNFVFDPVAYLGTNGNNSNYSVNLTDQLKKENGSPAFLPGGYVWSFSVSGTLDFTPPRVIGARPSGENPVAQNTVLQLEFSEAINPITATGHATGNPNEPFNHIMIKYANDQNQDVYLSGNAVISNRFRTVEFSPDAVCLMPEGQDTNSCGEVPTCFPPDKNFTVTAVAATINQNGETIDIMSGITDAAGNSLDGNSNGTSQGPAEDNYSSNFNTSNELDLTPPEITAVFPAQGDQTVPGNTRLRADFNELLLSSSVNSDAFRVFDYACAGDDFPNDGACYPSGGFIAYAAGIGANLHVYSPYMDPLKKYNPRLVSQIKDLYQNCFNPAIGVCAAGQDSPNCQR